MRPKVKFLTVIWGDAYIRRFATLALPSFLAPGNLPAMAELTDLEVVIMTRREDVAFFEKHASFRRLRETCAVRFVEIDDLVSTSVYGVTLTLAYARPIIAMGREMLDTHFVFMNADFVLADGSLRSLSRHILAGRHIVLGPSFRSVAEAVEPHLKKAVDAESGVLSIAPRQLAALSLAHPHPTTIAKTVSQGFCHSTHPNQFFWQIDQQTILARYYLIFMLCLKPERVLEQVNSYCDYSFIPEMCPSGDEVAMGDSDEFFMLEMQDRDQEMTMLRLGRQPDQQIASSLSEWTTAEHRRAASHDILFHVGDVPPETAEARRAAQEFVDRIGRRLGPPVSHVRHKYWLGGVRWWQHYRSIKGLNANPPELAPLPRRRRLPFLSGLRRALGVMLRWVRPRIRRAARGVVGFGPGARPANPYWLDYRLLGKTAAEAFARPGDRVLVVRARGEWFDRFLPAGANARLASPTELLRRDWRTRLLDDETFDGAVLYATHADSPQLAVLVGRCEQALRPGGTCRVFLHNAHADSGTGNASAELVSAVEAVVGAPPRAVECQFIGGRWLRLSRRLLHRAWVDVRVHRVVGVPMALVRFLLGYPLLLLTHLRMRNRLPSAHYVPHCAAVAMRFTARPGLGADAKVEMLPHAIQAPTARVEVPESVSVD